MHGRELQLSGNLSRNVESVEVGGEESKEGQGRD